MKYKKTGIILLLLLVIPAIIYGLNSLSSNSSKELFSVVEKAPEDLKLNDLTIHVNGENISLFRVLNKTMEGKEDKFKYQNETLAKGKSQSVYFEDTYDQLELDAIQVKNFTDKDASMKDMRISEVAIDRKIADKYEVILPDGLKIGDSIEKILSIYGQPMNSHINGEYMELTYADKEEYKKENINVIIKFNQRKLVSFTYRSGKVLPDINNFTLDTEKINGQEPLVDVSKLKVGPKLDTISEKKVMMGKTEIKRGIKLQEFLEDGWKINEKKSDKAYGNLMLEKENDSIGIQMQNGYKEDDGIVSIQVFMKEGTKQLTPKLTGGVNGSDFDAILSEYGMPNYISNNKDGTTMVFANEYDSLDLNDENYFEISVAFNYKKELRYYSIALDQKKY